MGHDDIGGSYTGRYAVQTLKAKRIAVLDDRTAFGSGLADQFVKGVKAAGGSVLVREYVTDKTTDFNAVLTSLKGKKVDLIFFGGLDVQAAPIARTIHQLGLNARLLGAGGFVSQTFLKLAHDFNSPAGHYLLTLSIVIPLSVLAANLARSKLGRNWMAVRDMDTAAAVIGIPILRTKLLAFAISSFILGVAGALWAFTYLGTVEAHANFWLPALNTPSGQAQSSS